MCPVTVLQPSSMHVRLWQRCSSQETCPNKDQSRENKRSQGKAGDKLQINNTGNLLSLLWGTVSWQLVFATTGFQPGNRFNRKNTLYPPKILKQCLHHYPLNPMGPVWHPSIHQTCWCYFKSQPSPIQASSGLPSNPRERTSSRVCYLNSGTPPLACWSPICSGSAHPSWTCTQTGTPWAPRPGD